MEKQTVFIKRYPSKGELPKQGFVYTNQGVMYFLEDNKRFIDNDNHSTPMPNWWLEEIKLPSEEEIYLELGKKSIRNFKRFIDGANFILNHLKSNTNGKL